MNKIKTFTDDFSNKECFIFYDNYKIIKLSYKTFIYYNHIRNNNNDKIYTNSVSIEYTNHTKDEYYKDYSNHNRIKNFNDKINNFIKNELYLIPEFCNSYAGNYEKLEITKRDCINTIILNKNLFCISHNVPIFAHEITYMFPQIYFFIKIKEYITDLTLVISYKTIYTDFILKIFDINNYILKQKNTLIINNGITYFSNNLTCNITKYMYKNFFNDMIVKNVLLSKKNLNLNLYPKKILFLRNKTNVVTGDCVLNTEDIINLCKSYNYVNIDQCKLPLEETIILVNNATNIICETGSSMLHLLWNINIKPIILVTRIIPYFNTLALLYNESNEYFKLTSDNSYTDIAKITNSDIVYNYHDLNYLKTLRMNNDNIMYLDGIDNALKKNELQLNNNKYKINISYNRCKIYNNLHLILYSNGKIYDDTKKKLIDTISNVTDRLIIIHDYNLDKIKKSSWFNKIEKLPQLQNINGYRDGYFNCWKPFITKEVYEKMNDDDILYYVDSSQHFQYGFNQNIDKLCNIVIKEKIIAGSIGNDIQNSYCCNNILVWNKILNNSDNKNLLNLPHVLNSWYILTKNDTNFKFIEDWIYYCIYTDDNFINPLITYHHTVDQSIFNILVHKYNFKVFYAPEIDHNTNKDRNIVNFILNNNNFKKKILDDYFINIKNYFI